MKAQKTTSISLILLLSVLLIMSCKKEIEEPENISSPDSGSYLADDSTAAIMKEIADAVEQTYQTNTMAIYEAEAAIRSGYYYDERVLLLDLLLPATSKLYVHPRFRKFAVDTGHFRRTFCQIIEKGNYPFLAAAFRFMKSSDDKLGISSRIPPTQDINPTISAAAIYFPYSENFPALISLGFVPPDNKLLILKKPTIVFSDRDADATKGRDVFYCLSSADKHCYQDVYVDDNYAFRNATHIITVGADVRGDVQATPPKADLVHRIYHGTSRLTKQLDKFISFTGNGGGSEIKVCRINGYLRRSDEQIDDFAGDVVTLYYTRGEIRHKTWKRVYSVWDPNWNYQDIEQIYAVYEEDNRGTKTIDGTLRTTLSLPGKSNKIEGDIGFKIQTSTQDEIITQRKFDRKSYLRDGTNNQGWGFVPDHNDFLPGNRDWPVFDGGSIWNFTFPYRIY